MVLPLNLNGYQIALGVLAVRGGIIGYRLILDVERWASYLMLADLVLLTTAAFVVPPIGDLLAQRAVSSHAPTSN